MKQIPTFRESDVQAREQPADRVRRGRALAALKRSRVRPVDAQAPHQPLLRKSGLHAAIERFEQKRAGSDPVSAI